MSLRQDLIDVIYSNLTAEEVLDAMLDLLTERADEWERETERLGPSFGARVQVFGEVARGLTAVLREEGSSDV